MEKESGYVIKILRFDKGGHFILKEFNKFCEYHEIHRPLMVHISPQQKGESKREKIELVK